MSERGARSEGSAGGEVCSRVHAKGRRKKAFLAASKSHRSSLRRPVGGLRLRCTHRLLCEVGFATSTPHNRLARLRHVCPREGPGGCAQRRAREEVRHYVRPSRTRHMHEGAGVARRRRRRRAKPLTRPRVACLPTRAPRRPELDATIRREVRALPCSALCHPMTGRRRPSAARYERRDASDATRRDALGSNEYLRPRDPAELAGVARDSTGARGPASTRCTCVRGSEGGAGASRTSRARARVTAGAPRLARRTTTKPTFRPPPPAPHGRCDATDPVPSMPVLSLLRACRWRSTSRAAGGSRRTG